MAEAEARYAGTRIEFTPEGPVTAGKVLQLKDGRAAYAEKDISSGEIGIVVVGGVARVTKTAGIVLLDGGDVYWDHSANAAHFKPVNDRDFLMGSAVGDASVNATVLDVALNEQARHLIDLARDGFLSTIVGTQGVNTMGVFRQGGMHRFVLSSTNEAQKLDALSVPGFATGANAIIEMIFAVANDGAGAAPDISIGVANGTHASDADAIAESIFVHLNGNDTTIYLESDDGTTEVAGTSSTYAYTEGSAVANLVTVWLDMRTPADVQVYVNGVLALGSTTFNVNAAAGPWFLLCHVEKTAAADVYELHLHRLRCRIGEK